VDSYTWGRQNIKQTIGVSFAFESVESTEIQPFVAIALTVSYEHDEMTGGSTSGKTKQNLRPGCSVD
jgi:hypothetical protein